MASVSVDGPPQRSRSELQRKKEGFHTPGYIQTMETVGEEAAAVVDPDQLNEVKTAEQEAQAMIAPVAVPVSSKAGGSGTILEAAFVDPAYPWPPADGQGNNAIELQASLQLLDEEASVGTTESMRERMMLPERSSDVPTKKWWQCCRSNDAVMDDAAYRSKKMSATEARKAYAHMKKEKLKNQEKERRRQQRYSRVPEGILIYRLDTSTHKLELMSPPHDKTDMSTLIQEMIIVKATASPDKTRRGMDLVGQDGKTAHLVACEQRTATAWLEAMHLMCAKEERKTRMFGMPLKVCICLKWYGAQVCGSHDCNTGQVE